jgi:urea carboxylase system permease
VGFSYLSILTGLPFFFYLGFRAGGPAFFWTWPTVFLGQFMIALCFAELAARYPLSGGIYQWSKQTGARGVGGMAGWIYLACSVVTLASVALALQATLPQIAPWFQVIGNRDDSTDSATNAVLLGCILIAVTTLLNSFGVRLLSRINNLGVFTEIGGIVLLVVLLGWHARRGPGIVFDTQGRGIGRAFGYLGPFLAATLTASYVMYGFDTAGSLAEETIEPRKRAPRAILRALGTAALAGALLILVGLLAAADLGSPELSRVSGGLPSIIRETLGPRLGTLLLADVVLAIFVCALTVQAGTVRLIFAMARDNNLPFSRSLARVREASQTPVLPALVTGAAAVVILVAYVGFPEAIEAVSSVAVVWANLAYLLVTLPLLVRRLEGWQGDGEPGLRGVFTLGRWGLPVNIAAVVWGTAVVVNIGWPRPEIYGTTWYWRYSAWFYTAALVAAGTLYSCFGLVRRNKAGILPEHSVSDEAEPGNLPWDSGADA